MSRLLRPFIPYSVRAKVLERQFVQIGGKHDCSSVKALEAWGPASKVAYYLRHIFGENVAIGEPKVHLDHDPALVNRPFNKRTGKYTPDANDPEHLIYRT